MQTGHRGNVALKSREQGEAQIDQPARSVGLLDPLLAQREARSAAVKRARYDLQRSKVYAPFDAWVTLPRWGVSALLIASWCAWYPSGNGDERGTAVVRPDPWRS